jgi:hypothetical protein
MVLAELRMDVELQVQHAVLQMQDSVRSWVCEEVAAARKGIESEVCKACVSWASDRGKLMDSQAKLEQRFEQLQQSTDTKLISTETKLETQVAQLQRHLDGQMHTMVLLEDACRRHRSCSERKSEELAESIEELNSTVKRLRSHLHAEMLLVEECSLKSMEELHGVLHQLLESKAPLADHKKLRSVLEKRAEEREKKQRAMSAELLTFLEEVASAHLQQGEIVQKHEDYIKGVSEWLGQSQVGLEEWLQQEA